MRPNVSILFTSQIKLISFNKECNKEKIHASNMHLCLTPFLFSRNPTRYEGNSFTNLPHQGIYRTLYEADRTGQQWPLSLSHAAAPAT